MTVMPALHQPDFLVDVLGRLTAAADMNARWETSVAIARELGADALNVVRFRKGNPAPVWFRVSTHERGGLEDYVTNDYMSVDPVLTRYWQGEMQETDHISLHSLIAAGGLSEKTDACYAHLLKYGQSDYITFLLPDSTDEAQEVLVVLACSAGAAQEFLGDTDRLAVLANLFAVYVGPPTPAQPEGKVPLLYDFLSAREQDVLSCLAKGMHNSEVAHHLDISEVTVRLHTTNARKRMGAATRAQAVALALSRGLIKL